MWEGWTHTHTHTHTHARKGFMEDGDTRYVWSSKIKTYRVWVWLYDLTDSLFHLKRNHHHPETQVIRRSDTHTHTHTHTLTWVHTHTCNKSNKNLLGLGCATILAFCITIPKVMFLPKQFCWDSSKQRIDTSTHYTTQQNTAHCRACTYIHTYTQWHTEVLFTHRWFLIYRRL